jgi:hypothetical protein
MQLVLLLVDNTRCGCAFASPETISSCDDNGNKNSNDNRRKIQAYSSLSIPFILLDSL